MRLDQAPVSDLASRVLGIVVADGPAKGQIQQMSLTFFLKLHDEPPIYVIRSGWLMVSGFKHCLRDAGGRRFHVLVSPSWDIEQHADQLQLFANMVEAACDGSTVTVLCPSEAEVALLKSRGLNTIHAHPNAFIDHTIFRPHPDLAKRFSAIYVGAMTDWKRHELAWDVENMCVVTYRHRHDDDDSVIRGYRHLSYTNLRDDGVVDRLAPEAVARLICEASCGLILSKTEGQNNASGEYQFCGIPTISTPSTGGRAAFFDPGSTIIVKPDSGLVKQAVDFAVRNPLPPDEIRARVIQKALPHRERLISWMSRVTGENLQARADRFGWLPQFRDKLREQVPVF